MLSLRLSKRKPVSGKIKTVSGKRKPESEGQGNDSKRQNTGPVEINEELNGNTSPPPRNDTYAFDSTKLN